MYSESPIRGHAVAGLRPVIKMTIKRSRRQCCFYSVLGTDFSGVLNTWATASAVIVTLRTKRARWHLIQNPPSSVLTQCLIRARQQSRWVYRWRDINTELISHNCALARNCEGWNVVGGDVHIHVWIRCQVGGVLDLDPLHCCMFLAVFRVRGDSLKPQILWHFLFKCYTRWPESPATTLHRKHRTVEIFCFW